MNTLEFGRKCLFGTALCLLTGLYVYGQPTGEPSGSSPRHLQLIQEFIEEAQVKIDNWEWQATISMLLVIVVAILGIISAALQKWNYKLIKILTVTIGISMSCLMIVINEAFPEDHRLLRSKADRARSYVRDMRGIATDFDLNAPPEVKSDWLNKVQSLMRKIDALDEVAINSTVLSELVSTAYAAAPSPEWIVKTPTDERNLYFVGCITAQSLSDAKEQSLTNATDLAENSIARKLQDAALRPGIAESSALREYIQNASEVVDSYLGYDRESRSVRYCTLLRLNKRFVEQRAVELFSGGTITAGNTASQVGPDLWKWAVFVTGPDEILDAVKCVKYTLHSTFPTPVKSICRRGDGPHAFPLEATGWGTFRIPIQVTYKDGRVQELGHELRFSFDDDCTAIDEFLVDQRSIFRVPSKEFGRQLYLYVGDVERGDPTDVHIFETDSGAWPSGKMSEDEFSEGLDTYGATQRWQLAVSAAGDTLTFDYGGRNYRLVVTRIFLSRGTDRIQMKICADR